MQVFSVLLKQYEPNGGYVVLRWGKYIKFYKKIKKYSLKWLTRHNSYSKITLRECKFMREGGVFDVYGSIQSFGRF